MGPSYPFVSGMITMGFIVASIFFVRFWWRTRDALFLAFAAGFLLLSANQGLVTLLELPREEASRIYLLRILAFGVIVAGIIWKNRTVEKSARAPQRDLPET